jgi:diguanylate cyclase (GGDEF)-like protein
MDDAMAAVAEVARELSQKRTLEALLQIVVDRAALLLGAARVSVRLFDVSRTRLIATCRSGEPLYRTGPVEFKVGEGLLGWITEHNLPLRTGDAEHDPRFVERPEIDQFSSFLGVPLTTADTCFGVIAAIKPERDAFTERDEQTLMLLAALCAPHLELARLGRLTQVDPLTGVLNRRGLDLVLGENSPALSSVAMCDLDRFKRINDAYGHAAGDEVLRRVAQLLAQVLRAGDGVIRWGGEEFLVVLPGIELERARRIVERARSWIEREPIEIDGHQLDVTISVGVAERRPGEIRASLIARADEALYVAKQAGRNRVELAA